MSRAERRRQRLLIAQEKATSTADEETTDDPISAALHEAVVSAPFHAPLLVPPTEPSLGGCSGPGAFGFFDMIIVVTRPSRRERVQRMLRVLCLSATLLGPPSAASVAARSLRARNGTDNALSDSELRVAASMSEAHQLFLSSTANRLLLFEDSFVPSGPQLHARLAASLAAMPSQWDLLFLGRCHDACDGEHLGGDLYRTFKPRCLHAHAATREGSTAFLEALESCPVVPCPADLAATSVAYVRGSSFAVSPSLFVQSPALRLTSGLTASGVDRRTGLPSRRRRAYYPECENERTNAFHAEALGRSNIAPAWRRRSVQELEALNGIAQLIVHAAAHGHASLPSCVRLAPRGRVLDDADVHDAMLVPSLDMSACALQYVACVRRGECTDTRDASRQHLDGAGAWRGVQRWKQDDTLCPKALGAAQQVAAIHLQQTLAGALFAPSVLNQQSQKAQQHLGPRFFEDASWPKAPSCVSDPGAKQNDLAVRTTRVVRSSELNPNRTGWLYMRRHGVVFKPMIKVGSNFYRTYLMCLMPDEWERIPESAILPSARAVVMVRHPFSRFVSALGEALARVFNRRCPRRQCNAKQDNYMVNGPWRSIRMAVKGTRWYSEAALVLASHARQFALRNGTGGPLRFDEGHLQRLVSSFVHDTVCNRNYYASEHFLTQTALMSQPLDPKSGIPTVPISDVVHTEDVQRSGSVDYERLMAALGMRPKEEHHARAAECYARASTDGNVASSKRGIRALPRAAALLRIVDADPSVQSLLCAVYYADFVCLGYQLPAICNAMVRA